eukprot:4184183-Pleurochrysis_carterae.AAC.1
MRKQPPHGASPIAGAGPSIAPLPLLVSRPSSERKDPIQHLRQAQGYARSPSTSCLSNQPETRQHGTLNGFEGCVQDRPQRVAAAERPGSMNAQPVAVLSAAGGACARSPPLTAPEGKGVAVKPEHASVEWMTGARAYAGAPPPTPPSLARLEAKEMAMQSSAGWVPPSLP